MQTFTDDLSKAIRNDIVSDLTKKLEAFAAKLAETPECKLTQEQIFDVWTEATGITPKKRAAKHQYEETKVCAVIMRGGKNVNNKCGKKCLLGLEVCLEHSKKEKSTVSTVSQVAEAKTDGPKCQHILVSGERKGKPCDKKSNDKLLDGKFCTLHAKAHLVPK